MINTNIRFNGFYNSLHSDLIDDAIESYYTDDNGVFNYDSIVDNIDYKTIHKDYIEVFTDEFKSWIQDNYNLDIDFKDLNLISPQYYNYSTDVINCNISEKDNALLMITFKRDKDFIDYLKYKTTSRDGFMSHYTFEEALSNQDDILSDYILNYLVNKFESDNLFMLDSYDFIYQSLH
jgi:hypothetical protein